MFCTAIAPYTFCFNFGHLLGGSPLGKSRAWTYDSDGHVLCRLWLMVALICYICDISCGIHSLWAIYPILLHFYFWCRYSGFYKYLLWSKTPALVPVYCFSVSEPSVHIVLRTTCCYVALKCYVNQYLLRINFRSGSQHKYCIFLRDFEVLLVLSRSLSVRIFGPHHIWLQFQNCSLHKNCRIFLHPSLPNPNSVARNWKSKKSTHRLPLGLCSFMGPPYHKGCGKEEEMRSDCAVFTRNGKHYFLNMRQILYRYWNI
jgi:hypothetical protein